MRAFVVVMREVLAHVCVRSFFIFFEFFFGKEEEFAGELNQNYRSIRKERRMG